MSLLTRSTLCFGSLLKEDRVPTLGKVGFELLPLSSKRSRWDGLCNSGSRGAAQLVQGATGRGDQSARSLSHQSRTRSVPLKVNQ